MAAVAAGGERGTSRRQVTALILLLVVVHVGEWRGRRQRRRRRGQYTTGETAPWSYPDKDEYNADEITARTKNNNSDGKGTFFETSSPFPSTPPTSPESVAGSGSSASNLSLRKLTYHQDEDPAASPPPTPSSRQAAAVTEAAVVATKKAAAEKSRLRFLPANPPREVARRRRRQRRGGGSRWSRVLHSKNDDRHFGAGDDDAGASEHR